MFEDNKIWLITDLPLSSVQGARGSEDVGGLLRQSQPTEPSVQIKTAIPVETLKKEMDIFLKDVGAIFSQAEQQLEKQETAMQLDEIELSIEINAEGQISLFGIGGKAGGKGAITLKFKRKEAV